jgi:flagellar motor switch protein FliM
MRPGDVIPIDLPETARIRIAGVPCFRGVLGSSKGSYAVKITDRIEHKRGGTGA